MTTATNLKRTAFEAWHKLKYPSMSLTRTILSSGALGAYKNSTVSARWAAWEASAETPQVAVAAKPAQYLVLCPMPDGKTVVPVFCGDKAAVHQTVKLETKFEPTPSNAGALLDSMVNELITTGTTKFDEGPALYCYPVASTPRGAWWTKV